MGTDMRVVGVSSMTNEVLWFELNGTIMMVRQLILPFWKPTNMVIGQGGKTATVVFQYRQLPIMSEMS